MLTPPADRPPSRSGRLCLLIGLTLLMLFAAFGRNGPPPAPRAAAGDAAAPEAAGPAPAHSRPGGPAPA